MVGEGLMIIEIKGEFVTSADYERLHIAISRLVITTEDRWHSPDYIFCHKDRLEFKYRSPTTEDCIGVLLVIAENDIEQEELSRVRYTLHNKDQHEIMFIDEELLSEQ